MAQDSFNAASTNVQDLNAQLLAEAGKDKSDLLKMQALINAGADPNARDAKQKTALMVAVAAKNLGAATLLIDNKADMYAKDGKNSSDAMFLAIAHYNLPIVKIMLDKGFDPDKEPCHAGMTPLMAAAWLKQKDIADEIARRGADIHRKNPQHYNFTAMDYAEDNNKPHIAESLRKIDAQRKEQERLRELEEKARIERERIAAEKAALDVVLDAGIPTRAAVKLMKPLSLGKPRSNV